MARASTFTGLSLDEWASVLQIDPWSFNQFRFPGPKSAQCADVLYQFGWQKDHLSREEVADAIASAEKMIADELLYYPYPHYTIDESITYPRNYNRQAFGFAGDIRGNWKSFGTRWHKVIQGGVLNRTSIGTISTGGGGLVFSDLDGDGVEETFVATITNATIGTITNPYEIALYFVQVNRHDQPIDESWRIRPVRISINGNTATITGHKALLGNPTPEYAVDAQPMDARVEANYVSSVDCYRTFTDTTSPYEGVAKWKTDPNCSSGCTFQILPVCLGYKNNEQGQITASFGDPCTWPYAWEPDALQINYLSGAPLVNGRMEATLAKMVAYLSVSLLANDKCGCDRTNRILDRLRAPELKFQDASAQATSFQESTNNFPMTYGGQWAWARVSQNRHIEAIGI